MKLRIFSILFFTINIVSGQNPMLKGKINISISDKSFEADLKLDSIPEHIESLQVILNKNFQNVRFYKESDIKPDNITSDPGVSEEGYLYHFNNYGSNSLGVRFNYKDCNCNDSINDWMGNIAFVDNTLRLSEQSGWFPTLYDSSNDIYFNDIPYELKIECSDCNGIYINGQKPVKSKSIFASSKNKPFELMLFAGDFDFHKFNENYIINSNLNREEKKSITRTIANIKRYYSSKTNIEYSSAINFIHTSATDENSEFLFVSYPTITQVGNLELNYFFKSKNYQKYLFHEFAHYYFGKIFNANTPLRIFINEAFPEFMAMKYYKMKFGNWNFLKWTELKIKTLDNKSKHISKLESLEDYEPNINSYAYNYGALLLLAIESKIGEDNMWNWITDILKSNTTKTDYQFLIESLSKYTDKATLDDLKINIFQNENSEVYIKHCLKKRATTSVHRK